jgi:hypothetical protein
MVIRVRIALVLTTLAFLAGCGDKARTTTVPHTPPPTPLQDQSGSKAAGDQR